MDVSTTKGCRIGLQGSSKKCDNTSAMWITKNPLQHSGTKHIDVRHHFIRDHYNKVIAISFNPKEFQTTDIFTKPLPKDRCDQT